MLAVAAIVAIVGCKAAAEVESKKAERRDELQRTRNALIRKKEERCKEEMLLEEAKIGRYFMGRGLKMMYCFCILLFAAAISL